MKKTPRFLARKRAAPPRAPSEKRSIRGEETWWPPVNSAGVAVTEHTALQLPAILATMVVLATDVAVLPLGVYQQTPDGGRREATEHPAYQLFRRSPNGETTPIRWKSSWVGHALQHGSGYAEISRTGRGKPSSLDLLDPHTTRPERDAGRLGYRIAGGAWIPSVNVLHLAGFGFDGLCGYNFTRLMGEAIGAGLAAQEFVGEYFANGAEPGGVLQTDKELSDPAFKRINDDWIIKHGPGSRHRPAILEEGLKWVPTETDPQKSQLVETRKYQAVDVARPWRVPPHKVGDYSEAHLANIEASNLDYLMTALMGWLEGMEQECNLKLISPAEWAQGYYFEHNVNALMRGDIKSRSEFYSSALDKGWMNRDEVRRRENMNPIGDAGGGGKYLVQSQMIPLDQAGSEPGKAEPSPPSDPDSEVEE